MLTMMRIQMKGGEMVQARGDNTNNDKEISFGQESEGEEGRRIRRKDKELKGRNNFQIRSFTLVCET
jgi:hypothetical protein